MKNEGQIPKEPQTEGLHIADVSRQLPFALYIRNLQDGTVHEVRKYIKDNEGEISIWTNSWYGRHVIGQDCEFANGNFG